MIRIIFDSGEIIDCEHISKVYVEQYEMDKITVVGRLEDETYVRTSNSGDGESATDNSQKTSID